MGPAGQGGRGSGSASLSALSLPQEPFVTQYSCDVSVGLQATMAASSVACGQQCDADGGGPSLSSEKRSSPCR